MPFNKGSFLERAATMHATSRGPILLINKMLQNRLRSTSSQEYHGFPHIKSARGRGFIKTGSVFSWAYISRAGQSWRIRRLVAIQAGLIHLPGPESIRQEVSNETLFEAK